MTNPSAVRWCNERNLLLADENATPVFAWVDIETTGLDPHADDVLEIGIILTDGYGHVIPDSPMSTLVVDKDLMSVDGLRREVDSFVRDMHDASGLWTDIEAVQKHVKNTQGFQPAWVSETIQAHVQSFRPQGQLVVAGASVNFDRNFMQEYLPGLNEFFHYRTVDVSTLKEIARHVNPHVAENEPPKRDKHRVLEDLADSINLYYYYLDNLLFVVDLNEEKLV